MFIEMRDSPGLARAGVLMCTGPGSCEPCRCCCRRRRSSLRLGRWVVDRRVGTVVVVVLEWDSAIGVAVGVAADKSQHEHDILSFKPLSKLSLMNWLLSMPAK